MKILEKIDLLETELEKIFKMNPNDIKCDTDISKDSVTYSFEENYSQCDNDHLEYFTISLKDLENKTITSIVEKCEEQHKQTLKEDEVRKLQRNLKDWENELRDCRRKIIELPQRVDEALARIKELEE